MAYNVNPLDVLTEQFRKLPGIGKKSAQRIAFHILRMTDEQAEEFLRSIEDARKVIHLCPICQNLTDGEVCSVCANEKRDKSVICVVSSPQDVISIEKTNEFRGVYHVLHGVLSPVDHIGPKDLKITELLARLNGDEVKEVIVATAPTVEGDATMPLSGYSAYVRLLWAVTYIVEAVSLPAATRTLTPAFSARV